MKSAKGVVPAAASGVDVEAGVTIAFVIWVETGAVEANRMVALFRIRGENCVLVDCLEMVNLPCERSGLARMGPFCTVEEENWTGQQDIRGGHSGFVLVWQLNFLFAVCQLPCADLTSEGLWWITSWMVAQWSSRNILKLQGT